jgi:alpha-galactosidase
VRIEYDKEQQLFHLSNDQVSYVMGVLRNGHMGHFSFGDKLTGALKQDYFRNVNRGLTNYIYEGEFEFSLSHEKLEFPCWGTTDYRLPAIDITDDRGSSIIDFKFKGFEITDEKPEIPGLPSTRRASGQSKSLILTLEDSILLAELTLIYTIYRDIPIVTRSAAIKYNGDSKLTLNRLMSMNLDFELIHLQGDWMKERHVERYPLHYGLQSIESNRGASSAIHNPFMAFARPHCTEQSGEVIGISLIYSGNFYIGAEVDSDHHLRVAVGINPSQFQWSLNHGESFHTPEAVLSYSNQGLNGLSHAFHTLIRNHIIHPKYRGRLNPVLINNWEATYFDFNEDKLLEIASQAKALGIELFVLDDGWFSSRNSDKSGLGDWRVNTEKLPSGLKGLSKKIHDMDMQFGLWIEPEMVNRGTPIYVEHPEWIIGDPLRSRSHGRNQFILDFSRTDVVDAIYHQLVTVLDEANADYLKWDMNRNITEAYSAALGLRQGELFHRYILGVYNLYSRLTMRYPNLLIESCAAGGGRFDMGMLYFAPQAWTSDNSDAVERLKIQYGTSYLYPLSTMGAHVTATPNHQVKRVTSLKLRADVAYFGSFGYELDLTKLTPQEKEEIKTQVMFYKENRALLLYGDFYRLISPFEGDGNLTAWQVVSKDRKEAILGYYQVLAKPNAGLSKIKPVGLEPNAYYRVSGYDEPLSGNFLMHSGLLIKPAYNGIESTELHDGDFQSRLYIMTQVEADNHWD